MTQQFTRQNSST